LSNVQRPMSNVRTLRVEGGLPAWVLWMVMFVC